MSVIYSLLNAPREDFAMLIPFEAGQALCLKFPYKRLISRNIFQFRIRKDLVHLVLHLVCSVIQMKIKGRRALRHAYFMKF